MIKEMEEEEEVKAAQEFYGEKAYQDWLQKQNLPPKGTGPSNGKSNTGQQDVKGSKGLAKPNSRANKPWNSSPVKKTDTKSATTATTLKSHRSLSPLDRKPITVSNTEEGSPPHTTESGDTKETKEKTPTYVNPDDWKIPLQVPKMQYLPNLKDIYPRDQYTRMPKIKSAPMYFDGRFGPKMYLTEPDDKIKRLKMKEHDVDLPKEVISKIMSKDPTQMERPVLFKSIHMDDVNKKKKYDVEEKGRSEVSLHLCDDMKSILFQNALKRSNTFHGGTLPSSSRTLTSDWTSDKYPRSKVADTMRNMSKPDRYPNIKGEEYVFNFGDLSVC